LSKPDALPRGKSVPIRALSGWFALLCGFAKAGGPQFARPCQHQIFKPAGQLIIAPGINPAIAGPLLQIGFYSDRVGAQFEAGNKKTTISGAGWADRLIDTIR